MPENPVLSVVVVIVSDTVDRDIDVSHLRRCLRALETQPGAPAMEVIVPHYPAPEVAAAAREFPSVRFLEIQGLKTFRRDTPGREHHDELRARGLAAARGAIVGLLEDHGVPDPDWCARAVQAHAQAFDGVGGAIENAVDRALNWAVYYCDFLRYQNPLPAGESASASDANLAYKREALERVRPVWQEIFHETAVNGAIRAGGGKLALCPEMVVRQNRGALRLGTALRERLIWGRSYAGTRSALVGGPKRIVLALLSPVLPVLLLARMFLNAKRKGRGLAPFLRALPYTAALVVSWSLGEIAGYLTGRAGSSGAPAAEAILRRTAGAHETNSFN
jgi:hypothetical protein